MVRPGGRFVFYEALSEDSESSLNPLWSPTDRPDQRRSKDTKRKIFACFLFNIFDFRCFFPNSGLCNLSYEFIVFSIGKPASILFPVNEANLAINSSIYSHSNESASGGTS